MASLNPVEIRMHFRQTVKMAPINFVPPMLAKLVKVLPEGPQWEYELKLDGYRLQRTVNKIQKQLSNVEI